MNYFPPFLASQEGIDPRFEPLAAQIRDVDGIENVSALFLYETRGVTPAGCSSELIIIVSAVAGALGSKALDVVSELVRDYLKQRLKERRTSAQVTIYDKNGQAVKRVNID